MRQGMRQFGQGHTGVPMDSPLHLLLLHLTVALTVGGNGYQVDQPARLSAVEGGSVTLPCSFSYPAHLRPRGFDVMWWVGHDHGLTIFTLSPPYTHWEYEGRITFLGSPDHNHTASIRLDRLRMSDSGRYICWVKILGERHAEWQSDQGTDLSVQAPTERPSVTVTVTVVVESTTPRGSPPWVLFVAKGGGLLLLLLGAGVVIWICQRKRRRRRRDCLGVVWSGRKGDPVTSGDKERRRADVEPRGDGQPAHHHAGEL
ncbi:paired immunoglobulin-like type 2 receptor beta [Rhinoraja longicauda]